MAERRGEKNTAKKSGRKKHRKENGVKRTPPRKTNKEQTTRQETGKKENKEKKPVRPVIKEYKALLQQNIIYNDRIDEYGIGKFQFEYFVKTYHYKRIAKGTYKFEGDESYKLYLLYKIAPSGVLSHNTALYYHGLINEMLNL